MLIVYGALDFHDSPVLRDNVAFFDLLEGYFNQPPENLRKDERSVLTIWASRNAFQHRRPTPEHENTLTPSTLLVFLAHEQKRPYETRPEFSALNSFNVVPSSESWKHGRVRTIYEKFVRLELLTIYLLKS